MVQIPMLLFVLSMKMKWIFMLTFCGFTCIRSPAQYYLEDDEIPEEEEESYFEFGVEGGPALTTTWGYTYNTQMEGNYMVGSWVRYSITKWFGIHSGVYIERGGSKLDVIFTDQLGNKTGDGNVKFMYDYLTCPIMWRFDPINTNFNLNISLGGFVSYMFAAHSVLSPFPPGTPNDPNPGKETTYDESMNFQKINAGIAAGVGLDYNFDFGFKTGFEVRDQLGLVHMSMNPETPTFSYRTNSLQFLFRVGYRF